MECGGMVTSSAASRIPVQYVAESTSGDVSRELDGIESRRPRYYNSSNTTGHCQKPRRDGLRSPTSSHGGASTNGVDSPPGSVPHQMDDSVETLLREWDSGLRSRTETTLAVRPLAVPPSRPERDRRPRHRVRGNDRLGPGSSRRTASSSGMGDSLRRSEASGGGYSSEEDSLEEGNASVRSRTWSVSTRSPGVDASSGRTFRVEFDVDGYDVQDLQARVCPGRRLVVQGVRRHADGGRTCTTEFCRKIRLPDDVDAARLDCFLQPDGRVVVEAPRHERRPALPTSFQPAAASEPLLNVPVVGGDDRRQMSLSVEVGRLFRADDVVVKVKNSALTLTVVAERCEQPGDGDGTAGMRRGRLKASVTWEFDVPGALDVDTLRAGLTVDGLLRVTARLLSSLPPPDINTAV